MSLSSLESSSPSSAPTQAEDIALLVALGTGDAASLAALYDRYAKIVFSLASRMLGDARESEEVTQDVFLALWRHPSRYRPATASPLTWIASITRNKCVDRLRKHGRRPSFADLPSGADETPDRPSSDHYSDPFQAVALNDLSAQMRECLDRLSEAQRLTVESAFFEGLDVIEISRRDQLPAATVKSRLRLAFDKLRRCLRHKNAE